MLASAGPAFGIPARLPDDSDLTPSTKAPDRFERNSGCYKQAIGVEKQVAGLS
jgi:hypothetical protein